jgi:hypothetical protein
MIWFSNKIKKAKINVSNLSINSIHSKIKKKRAGWALHVNNLLKIKILRES